MNLQHLVVKIPVDGDLAVEWERFIEVFHGWVAAQSMDELLIDVVDYRHVPAGPGVLLVAHEADYAMDNAKNRPGLRYQCKASQEGSNEDRVRHALTAAARASLRLESQLDGLRFGRQEFELAVNDRALAPNTADNQQACEAELRPVLQSVLGVGDVRLDFESDPRCLLGAVVTTDAPVDWAGLASASPA